MNRIEPTTLCVEPQEVVRERPCMVVPHKHMIWCGEDVEYIGVVTVPNQKQEEWWQYNAPVGACTVTSPKAKRFYCIAVLSLAFTRVCLREIHGGVGLARRMFNGNAMKVYLGMINRGSLLPMHLFLKGTAT